MNSRRVALIFVAAVIASCSEKSGLDPNKNSQAEAKPTQTIAALIEKRTNQSEVERFSASDAQSSETEGENELQPREDEIAEDCVAFLRSTKTVPPSGVNADCPQCPMSTEAKEVLKFDDIRVDRVAHSESACEVHVTIHATFNPSTRQSIAGGLTAWISPEQTAQYLRGRVPSDQQVYEVKVIYKRDRRGWRAIEFDRP